jgi:hypothetical protein
LTLASIAADSGVLLGINLVVSLLDICRFLGLRLAVCFWRQRPQWNPGGEPVPWGPRSSACLSSRLSRPYVTMEN